MRKTYLYSTLVLLLLVVSVVSAQTKIGNNPNNINVNAVLEIESTNKGILLPRLSLISTSSFSPLTAHINGMMVYNLASTNDVNPGIYFNDGTQWVKINTTISFLSGTVNPASATGANGDFYINTATNTIFGPKAAGAWPATGTSIVGAAGTNGTNGTNGIDGKTVLNGTIPPAAVTGANGDFYINTATNTIFGPKAAGAWPATGTSLVGPAGSNATVTASNGLTAIDGTVTLGGTLSTVTTIAQGTNNLVFSGSGQLNKLSGAVGSSSVLNIGRTSTELELGVAGAATQGFSASTIGDGWFRNSSTGNLLVGTASSAALRLVTNNTERLTITPAGDVGIGTASPVAKLEVVGALKVGDLPTGAVPQPGMIRFNNATSKFQGYDGANWIDMH